MKKLLIILASLMVLFVFVSCYSTTFVNEEKTFSFVAGEGNECTTEMIDGTLYSKGTSENGDSYFCYYTKSQRKYDMFELGIINKSGKSVSETETMIEFFCGDYGTDSWKRVGKWDSNTCEGLDDDSSTLIFAMRNKKDFGSDSLLSGRIYIKNFLKDYKVVYTTESGEKITSYFKVI